jgi:hypothetical protein
MSWSGGRCRGVAGDGVERMRAHGGALDDITRAVDLDGAKTVWRLQKAKLLAGLGRCDDAAAEHAASRGNADADGPKYAGPLRERDAEAKVREGTWSRDRRVSRSSRRPAASAPRPRARSDAPRRVDRRPSKKEEEEISFSSKKEEEEISFS